MCRELLQWLGIAGFLLWGIYTGLVSLRPWVVVHGGLPSTAGHRSEGGRRRRGHQASTLEECRLWWEVSIDEWLRWPLANVWWVLRAAVVTETFTQALTKPSILSQVGSICCEWWKNRLMQVSRWMCVTKTFVHEDLDHLRHGQCGLVRYLKVIVRCAVLSFLLLLFGYIMPYLCSLSSIHCSERESVWHKVPFPPNWFMNL